MTIDNLKTPNMVTPQKCLPNLTIDEIKHIFRGNKVKYSSKTSKEDLLEKFNNYSS